MNIGDYRFLFALCVAVAGILFLVFLKQVFVQYMAQKRLRDIRKKEKEEWATEESADAVFRDNEAFFKQRR